MDNPMATSATSVSVERDSSNAAMRTDAGIYVGFREYTPRVDADPTELRAEANRRLGIDPVIRRDRDRASARDASEDHLSQLAVVRGVRIEEHARRVGPDLDPVRAVGKARDVEGLAGNALV